MIAVTVVTERIASLAACLNEGALERGFHFIAVTDHQGAITADHLQSYLEEFTFRFNRRTSRNRGLVFRRLLEQAVVTGPVTESDVTGGYDW